MNLDKLLAEAGPKQKAIFEYFQGQLDDHAAVIAELKIELDEDESPDVAPVIDAPAFATTGWTKQFPAVLIPQGKTPFDIIRDATPEDRRFVPRYLPNVELATLFVRDAERPDRVRLLTVNANVFTYSRQNPSKQDWTLSHKRILPMFSGGWNDGKGNVYYRVRGDHETGFKVWGYGNPPPVGNADEWTMNLSGRLEFGRTPQLKPDLPVQPLPFPDVTGMEDGTIVDFWQTKSHNGRVEVARVEAHGGQPWLAGRGESPRYPRDGWRRLGEDGKLYDVNGIEYPLLFGFQQSIMDQVPA